MSFTAKDVQKLRQATGAGMMECKRALEETDGDFDAAVKLLREKGLAKSVDRSDRENSDGVVAIATGPGVAAIVELKSETDFSAKKPEFVAAAQQLADTVAAGGSVDDHKDLVDDFKVTLKENIEVGRVEKVDIAEGQVQTLHAVSNPEKLEHLRAMVTGPR